MKLSVSLPEEDVATLDRLVAEAGLESRSAAVRRAIQALRLSALESQYAAAFEEWAGSDDDELWDPTAGDGIAHASR